MPAKISTKSFLVKSADWFTKSDKIEANMYLSKLVNIRYKDKKK